MNKFIIGGIVLVVLAGAALFFAQGGDSDYSQQSNSETSGETQTFEAMPTKDQSFEAEITGTADGVEYTGAILSDGQGNIKYTAVSNGQASETYLTSEGTIVCSAGSCFMASSSESSVPVDQDQYQYDEEDYSNFKDNADYIGREDCLAGTCDVWEITQTEGTTRVFIGDDKRVSKVTTEVESGLFEITYDYKEVSINIPQNVQSF